MYHFPEDKGERDRWISAVPRSDLKDIFETFEKKETIIVNGKEKNKRKKKPRDRP